MFVLIDCNSFYCSCETVFNPKLRNTPIVVMSNNDGCCVSRTQAAKDLGIPMGAPLFQIKDLVRKHQVNVFSSNYTLYADISNRVMNVIASIMPVNEIYSIDECFCIIPDDSTDKLEQLGHQVRDKVKKWVGIPVSVGIAPTKVLAKVANKIAKKNTGVLALTSPEAIDKALHSFPVDDLWGIGRRYAQRLESINVKNAFQYRSLSEQWLKKEMTVNCHKIALELKGISCIPLELFKPKRQMVGSSKGFGQPVETFDELREALTAYTTTCAIKLKNEKSITVALTVSLQTDFFRTDAKQYSNSVSVRLAIPTSNTLVLVKQASKLLGLIFRPGYKYKRVGILFSELTNESHLQSTLFDAQEEDPKRNAAQKAMDELNARFQLTGVRLASQGFEHRWKMNQGYLSPKYTTRAEDFLTVNI